MMPPVQCELEPEGRFTIFATSVETRRSSRKQQEAAGAAAAAAAGAAAPEIQEDRSQSLRDEAESQSYVDKIPDFCMYEHWNIFLPSLRC